VFLYFWRRALFAIKAISGVLQRNGEACHGDVSPNCIFGKQKASLAQYRISATSLKIFETLQDALATPAKDRRCGIRNDCDAGAKTVGLF
jgi:hypothetical protein